MSSIGATAGTPILIGLGANLTRHGSGPPLATCEAALAALASARIQVVQRSRWYRSAPLPASMQPWFVNGVARVRTRLGPRLLLARLQAIERRFGRRRPRALAARTLDLDLLAYGSCVSDDPALWLPHPRLPERAFVLLPLAEVAPDWRHPRLGLRASELAARLPDRQRLYPVEARLGIHSTRHIFHGIQSP